MFRYIGVLLLICILGMSSSQAAGEMSIPVQSGVYKMYDQSHALIIGVSKYDPQTGWPVLPAVKKEIENVNAALTKQGFTTEIVTDPDFISLQKAVREFFNRRWSRDTRLILYFAGHGHSDQSEDMGYILPRDTLYFGDADFFQKAFSMSEIRAMLPNGRRAKHVLLVFNSCFSGSIFLTRRNTLPPEIAYLSDIDRPGWQYITAGTAQQEVPDNLSFSQAFIDGIEGGADRNKDELVTASELGFYINTQLASDYLTPQFGNDRSPNRKLGDLVFSSPKSDHVVGQLTAKSPDGAGLRKSTLRSQTVAAENKLFDGVELIYYRKTADGRKVSETLERSGIPYSVTRAELPDKFAVNSLACAPNTPIDAIKTLAIELLKNGVPLKRILRFRRPSEKPRRIELLSLTKNGRGIAELQSANLTIQQVESLNICPTFLGS
ncbi:caspase domain-containing protein [Pseudahrensia aquimaris]|uniref:Caspase domain-containing protein n=1 Tax=Pseudahrensia aquimaris TaxID=744461 RepID=A0ABW3FFX8_9HYPH